MCKMYASLSLRAHLPTSRHYQLIGPHGPLIQLGKRTSEQLLSSGLYLRIASCPINHRLPITDPQPIARLSRYTYTCAMTMTFRHHSPFLLGSHMTYRPATIREFSLAGFLFRAGIRSYFRHLFFEMDMWTIL